MRRNLNVKLSGFELQEEQMRKRAYELWEENGRPIGKESEHWNQAVGEVSRSSKAKIGNSHDNSFLNDDEELPAPPTGSK